MIYLTLPELLRVARRVLGPGVKIRDIRLLEAALARPQTTAFGADAYLALDEKAAALLHSLARNHALVDGDKRLALSGLIAFYGVNGRRLALSNARYRRPPLAAQPAAFRSVANVGAIRELDRDQGLLRGFGALGGVDRMPDDVPGGGGRLLVAGPGRLLTDPGGLLAGLG